MKKTLHRILGGLSFTGALFAFQACYGMPQAACEQASLHGIVKNPDGMPIKNICVNAHDADNFCTAEPANATTNDSGEFTLKTAIGIHAAISLHDCDSSENGRYADMDTTINISKNKTSLNITMNPK